ncbi:MAG: type II toxin-antitoxin system RelE/ParE family toxin [Acidobacteriota bacterium]|nr:type II toxin-antitoxin system RelE/ParE family toxin [Acidobacteriota bacterium]
MATVPINWQRRIVAKIRDLAANPYASNNNVTKLQGRDGYRLRVGDWRIIYDLDAERLIVMVLEMGSRGGIY